METPRSNSTPAKHLTKVRELVNSIKVGTYMRSQPDCDFDLWNDHVQQAVRDLEERVERIYMAGRAAGYRKAQDRLEYCPYSEVIGT
jgi:hypothetical protein